MPDQNESVEIRCEHIDCPLCGSSNSTVVLTTTDVHCGLAGFFSIVKCAHCGHRFLNPRPVSEDLGLCYPVDYGPHQARVVKVVDRWPTSSASSVTRPWYLRVLPLRHVPGLRRFYNWLLDDRSQPVPMASEVERSVADEADLPRRPRALELGCATGAYLGRLESGGWAVVGVEPGKNAAESAVGSGFHVYCGTLDSCDLSVEGRFDLAAAWMVLEHVADPRRTLRQLFDLLVPSGTLLFSIPNAGCWEAGFFGRHWYAWEPPRHLHHFDPSSIRQLLHETGFCDIVITHQRNLSYVVGSAGLAWLSVRPGSKTGCWLRDYPGHPRLLVQLLLAPIAHFLAWIRQGGRLTIQATRPIDQEGADSKADAGSATSAGKRL